MSVTLGQLLEESPKLAVARSDDSVEAVMERMREHDYSQLPVVVDDGPGVRAIGLISTTTIARTSLYLGIPPAQLKVHHAIDDHPIRRSLDDDLWRTLEEVRHGEVLLVEDDNSLLRGILTGQDFTTYLRRQSEDSFAVLDIEQTIKQLIWEHYSGREAQLDELVARELGVNHRSLEKSVRTLVTRYLSSVSASPGELNSGTFEQLFQKHLPDKTAYEFDRLTFNQYQQILLSGECWAAYKDAFDLPVEHLRSLLTVARDLRNQIMHNRGLPTPAERARLVYCRQLLGRVADRRPEAVVVERVEAPVVLPSVDVKLADTAAQPVPAGPTVVEPAAAEPAAAEPGGESEESPGLGAALTSMLWDVDSKADRLSLRFEWIDRLIPGGLPAAAREHRSWFTNDEGFPQSAYWLDAGFRVVSVNLTEGAVTFGRSNVREATCLVIFANIFRHLANNPRWSLATPSPTGRTEQNLVNIAEDGGQAWLVVAFTKGDRFRILLRLNLPNTAVNKATFDALAEQRDAIEQSVGASLTWERAPYRRGSMVALYYPRPISIRSNEEEIDKLAVWVAENVPLFYEGIRTYYKTIFA
jgi:CBS domain-containing protein